MPRVSLHKCPAPVITLLLFLSAPFYVRPACNHPTLLTLKRGERLDGWGATNRFSSPAFGQPVMHSTLPG